MYLYDAYDRALLAQRVEDFRDQVARRLSGELTEDGLRDLEHEVQKLTDRFVKSVDEQFSRKEAEIMKV